MIILVIGEGGPGSGRKRESQACLNSMDKAKERGRQLGYKSIDFAHDPKTGHYQVIALGPKSKNPAKLNIFITNSGEFVDKDGRKKMGW